MCVTCGCGQDGDAAVSMPGDSMSHERQGEHEHVHADGTRHRHSHTDSTSVAGRDSRTLQLEQQILGKNQLVAERNRGWLEGRGVLALNLLSSPGAGKTSLLERTLGDLKSELKIAVVEGDQATSNDARRIRDAGARAVQINTGTGCHLEAEMIERAMRMLMPASNSLMLIENVGNLVCPALFDLGERAKVVLFSVTDGEDKPLKYPHIFSAAAVVILSKTDLLPHLRFDKQLALANLRSVNPQAQILELSAHTGEGLAQWYGYLRSELLACASVAA